LTVGPGSGPSSSLISSQYSCAPRASRPNLSCAKYSELIDLRCIYVFPTRSASVGAGCTGCGGAGQALITSGSKLLLFFVSPRFNRNGLLRSIGLSLPSSAALRAAYPTAVTFAEILGSWLVQGLWWSAVSMWACGRGDACHPVCTIGVLIALMRRTFPPLSMESKELAGERKSFSGTCGGACPTWRMVGVRLRCLRKQKYMKTAAAIMMTATGIMASPAIELDEMPPLPCECAAASVVVAGMVGLLSDDIVSGGMVKRCEMDIVACCMRAVGKGDDDDMGLVGC
jgi:hypothetical protein